VSSGDNDALLAEIVLNFDYKALALRLSLPYVQERSSSGFKVDHVMGSLFWVSAGNLWDLLTNNSRTGLCHRVVVRQRTVRLASHKPPAIAVNNSADVSSPGRPGNTSGIG
jgi:hypothetical protein